MPSKISEEDKRLFRDAMRDVTPLNSKERKVKANHETTPITPVKRSGLVDKPLPHPALSDYYPSAVEPETTLSYCQNTLARKRFMDLRKGRIFWQAKLDLHRLNADEAKQALLDFLMKQRQLGVRCVLIVHGKGSVRGEAPVLKNLVNHWLKQIPEVLAFHSALAKHGGNGALYVMLKKN